MSQHNCCCFIFKFENTSLDLERKTIGMHRAEKQRREIIKAMPFEFGWHVQLLGRQAATWQGEELEK